MAEANPGGPASPPEQGSDLPSMVSQLMSMMQGLVGEVQELRAEIEAMKAVDAEAEEPAEEEKGDAQETMNPDVTDEEPDVNVKKKLPPIEIQEQEQSEEEFRRRREEPEGVTGEAVDDNPVKDFSASTPDIKKVKPKAENTIPAAKGTKLMPVKTDIKNKKSSTPEPKDFEHPGLPPKKEEKPEMIPKGESPGGMVRANESTVPDPGNNKREVMGGMGMVDGANIGLIDVNPFKEYLRQTGKNKIV